MKKSVIYILCTAIIVGSVAFLNSCGQKELPEADETEYQSKSSSSQAEEIIRIPTETAEIADMFQAAINYVDGYCYGYTKSVEITVSDLALGSLSSVSNAQDAFRSILGEKKLTADYNYNADKAAFNQNFPNGNFEANNILSSKAEQKDGVITITVVFPNETDPKDEGGVLSRLGGDYLSADKVKENLKNFASSANSISISASDITVVARINASDSRLLSMVVTYTEKIQMTDVTLVQMKTGSVSGQTKVKVTYTDIG